MKRIALAVLAALLLTPVSRAQEARRVADVIYGKKLGVALTMDAFLPAGEPQKPPRIGVIWMVSGGWNSRHENINPAIAKPFTDRGMALFQVVHGSQPKFALSEIVADIHRAVRFVRAHAADYGVDPNRLAVAGGSAGGHLSMMMAAFGGPGKPDASDPVDRVSSAVQCAAVFYPPTDFLNYGKDGQSAIENPLLKGYWPAIGVTEAMSKDERAAVGRTFSPYYGLSKQTPPTLLIHGDADLLVPIQQSRRVVERLAELGVPCQLIVRPGKAHGWPGIENDLTLFVDWIAKHLPGK